MLKNILNFGKKTNLLILKTLIYRISLILLKCFLIFMLYIVVPLGACKLSLVCHVSYVFCFSYVLWVSCVMCLLLSCVYFVS